MSTFMQLFQADLAQQKGLTYGSVCSGIEAATAAWHPLGWQPAWFSEIETFPCAVLDHHYPDVPNLGDMTTIAERIIDDVVDAPDVLVGGTPCQSYSVAGLRKSLEDERGNLTLRFVELANAIDAVRVARGDKPSIIVWENVPGVLSTKDNAFGCFLAGLAGEDEPLQPTGTRWSNAGCVFGHERVVAWRILDAQYFGLAQRRKRVFVVASARKDCNPAEILFEFNGLQRDTPPSRSTAESATDSPAKCLTRRGAGGLNHCAETANMIVHGTQDPLVNEELAFPLGRNKGQENSVFSLQGSMIGRSDKAGPQGAGVSENLCFTLTKADIHAVAHAQSTAYSFDSLSSNSMKSSNPHSGCNEVDLSKTLDTSNGDPSKNQGGIAIRTNGTVRRLLPVECERLQGFPHNFTQIPYRNKPAEACPDSPRYAALGNSMAVPVMRWIGERIDAHIEENSFERV